MLASPNSRPASPPRQWQTSSLEENYTPIGMVPVIRGNTISPKKVRAIRAPYELPNDQLKLTRRSMKSPYDRLHETQTHTIHKRDIQSGLVPEHILKNEPPAAGHTIKSTDFFPANKFDRPKATPSPLSFAHSMTTTTSPSKAQLQSYQSGLSPSVPIRIVSHQYARSGASYS